MWVHLGFFFAGGGGTGSKFRRWVFFFGTNRSKTHKKKTVVLGAFGSGLWVWPGVLKLGGKRICPFQKKNVGCGVVGPKFLGGGWWVIEGVVWGPVRGVGGRGACFPLSFPSGSLFFGFTNGF